MKDILNYLHEAGMLKRIKRSGWWIEGIDNPETVSEHSWRAALLGLILAKEEGFSDEVAWKICAALVFHDMHEVRILDLNKISLRYLDKGDAEKKVETEQTEKLPDASKETIRSLYSLNDVEYQLVHDADKIECAIQAVEYLGKEQAKSWIENAKKSVKTDTGKKLLDFLHETDASEWWQGLKKV